MDNRVVYYVLCLVFVISSSTAQQFHQNTRYGKRNEIGSENSRPDCIERQQVMNQGRLEARNDRFISGSRYGKRNYVSLLSKPEDFGIQVNQPSLRNDRFFTGSRYGKRDSYEDSLGQVNQPSLRNDRFFTGVRYGKRDSAVDPEPDPDEPNLIARVFQPPCPVY